MSTSDSTLLMAFLGFSSIAAMTWFSSSRPRLFVRIFVPRDQLFGTGRSILRDTQWRSGMRIMAGLQFGVACVIGLIWLYTA